MRILILCNSVKYYLNFKCKLFITLCYSLLQFLILYLIFQSYSLFWEEIRACAAVRTRYRHVQLCVVHNSFALYDRDVIFACRAHKADFQ